MSDQAVQIAEDIYLEGPHDDPNSLLALELRGSMQIRRDESNQRRWEAALESYDSAIAREPNCAKAHFLRACALYLLNQFEEALQSTDQATQLKPDQADAYCLRGDVFWAQGRYEEALRSYDRAIQLEPNLAAAWFNSGMIYSRVFNYTSTGISNFERAARDQKYGTRARIASCIGELRILYENQAEIFKARLAYMQKLKALCEDFDSGRLTEDVVEAIETMQPFYLAYQQYCDLDLQALYGSLVCKIMRREFTAAPLPRPPAPGELVRVGFVSAFFYKHTNWKLCLKGWISQLDRRRFKVFGYHLGKKRDAETVAAAFMCDRFVHGLAAVGDYRKEILRDAPHVLIYPGLLMDSISLQLAAQRLAPVQCNSWGHPETSGMPTLDYFLSSDLMEPQNASMHYSEELIRLPNLSIYYIRSTLKRMTSNRADFGLRSDATVFWSGQALFKYLPQFDFIFADIAAQVDDCQFVFIEWERCKKVTEQFQARLDLAFKPNGLRYKNHCVFLPHLSQDEFVSAIGECDLILDSVGWSGGNSTFESLEHNLPIVTVEGSLMRGRHSAAILRMMGCTDTIAHTVDDYIHIAVELANNPAKRVAISRLMADNKHRVFCDRECISALEEFLDRVARKT